MMKVTETLPNASELRMELYSPVSGNRTVVTGKGDLEVSHQEKNSQNKQGNEGERKEETEKSRGANSNGDNGMRMGKNPRGAQKMSFKLVDEISWFWKSKMGLF